MEAIPWWFLRDSPIFASGFTLAFWFGYGVLTWSRYTKNHKQWAARNEEMITMKIAHLLVAGT